MALLAGPVFEFAGPFAAFASAGALVAVGAAIAFWLDPTAFSLQANHDASPDGQADYRSSVNVNVAEAPPSASR